MGDGNMTIRKKNVLYTVCLFFLNQFDFFLPFVSYDIPSMGQTTVLKQNSIVKSFKNSFMCTSHIII